MSNNKKESLQEKKKELEAELKDIEEEIDDSFDRVKDDVSNTLDPVEYIRRHPLPVVGLSVLVGFMIAREDEDHSLSDSKSKSDKLTSTIWYEIKRLATRKALSRAGDMIEDILD